MNKVHPSLKKRNISFNVASSSTPKKLRRLPHVFAKVLELPFHSGADVSVQETSHSFCFTVAVSPNDDNMVRAHTIEIYPGVTKIVIKRTDGGDLSSAVNEVGDHFDKWRFRLPASTRPELASATCTGQELVVTVPKVDRVHDDRKTRGGEEEEDGSVRLNIIIQ